MRYIISFFVIISNLFVTNLNADNKDLVKTIKEIQENIKFHTLSNGIRVIFYKRGYAPVFSGVVAIGVGGVDEAPGITGISHLFEHMAFKGTSKLGTKNYTKEKKLLAKIEEIMSASEAGNNLTNQQKKDLENINKELHVLWADQETIDKIYGKIGGVGLNATTGMDITNYFVSLPSNRIEDWSELESDRILDPVYRQFYKERDVVHEERRMRFEDNISSKLYVSLIKYAFLVHPYRNPVIGHKEDLDYLTASKLEDFQSKFYVPTNIVISIVGNLNFEETIKILERYFGRIKRKNHPEQVKLIEPDQLGPREFTIFDKSEPQFLMAYHKPNYPDREDLGLNLWLEAVLGGRTAIAYKELVLDRKIATSLDYAEGPGSKYPNLYFISARPNKISNRKLISELDKIFEKVFKKGVSEDRLNIVKQKLIVEFLSSLKSNLQLARSLSSAELIYTDWKYMLSWIEEIDSFSSKEINLLAKKYFNKNIRTIGYVERESIKEGDK